MGTRKDGERKLNEGGKGMKASRVKKGREDRNGSFEVGHVRAHRCPDGFTIDSDLSVKVKSVEDEL